MISKVLVISALVASAFAAPPKYDATSYSSFVSHSDVEPKHHEEHQNSPVAEHKPIVEEQQEDVIDTGYQYHVPELSEHHHEPEHVAEEDYHNVAEHKAEEAAEEHNYHHHPKYEFKYEVVDHHTKDIHGQHETRDGDVVKGVYMLHQPDGLIRIVKYTADKHTGFNADVTYSGHEAHPEHY